MHVIILIRQSSNLFSYIVFYCFICLSTHYTGYRTFHQTDAPAVTQTLEANKKKKIKCSD